MQQFFFIRTNGRYVKVAHQDILYVEGSRNYIRIVTENKSHLVLLTMKRMEQLLPASKFCRIHKSYIVSLDKILEFDHEEVCLKDKTLPIGEQYRGLLEKQVVIASDSNSHTLTVASAPSFYPQTLAAYNSR